MEKIEINDLAVLLAFKKFWRIYNDPHAMIKSVEILLIEQTGQTADCVHSAIFKTYKKGLIKPFSALSIGYITKQGREYLKTHQQYI